MEQVYEKNALLCEVSSLQRAEKNMLFTKVLTWFFLGIF